MPYKDRERRLSANRLAHQKWYAKNAERVKRDARAYKLSVKAAVNLIKESTPCLDCHKYYPACVMEFDHVRGEKEAAVAQSWHLGWSLERTMREIEKCELRCANCHRVKTYRNDPVV